MKLCKHLLSRIENFMPLKPTFQFDCTQLIQLNGIQYDKQDTT